MLVSNGSNVFANTGILLYLNLKLSLLMLFEFKPKYLAIFKFSYNGVKESGWGILISSKSM